MSAMVTRPVPNLSAQLNFWYLLPCSATGPRWYCANAFSNNVPPNVLDDVPGAPLAVKLHGPPGTPGAAEPATPRHSYAPLPIMRPVVCPESGTIGSSAGLAH